MTFNDCVDCPTEALAAMPCGCPPNAFARCAGGWIRCNERYAAWSRWQSESLLGRMVAADRKPDAGTPATDEPRGKMLHAALVTGRYTETRCPVPADDPPATDELPDDESSPRADAFGNEYPTDFDLAEQYYGKPKGEPATDDREFWEQAKDAQAEVDSWPEWKRGAAARARVSPATDESAAPERLTFELEELGKHPLTGESTSRLLAGLRHPVAYVREGALRGVEPHLGLEYFRDVVGRIARYDDDADVREIARDILGEDESAAEDRSGPRCTGITASWCPVHGDCTCRRYASGERIDGSRRGCPLHDDDSAHGEDDEDAHPAVAELARLRAVESSDHTTTDATGRRYCTECEERLTPPGEPVVHARDCLVPELALARAERDEARDEAARRLREAAEQLYAARDAVAERDEARRRADVMSQVLTPVMMLLGRLVEEWEAPDDDGILLRTDYGRGEFEEMLDEAVSEARPILAKLQALPQHTVASTDQPHLSEVTTSTMPRSAPVASEGEGPLGDGGIEE
jgi:hypothetical protein